MGKHYIIGIPAEIRVIKNLDRNSVNDDEVAGVIKHGGVPVLIPTRNPEIMEHYVDLIDGLLLPGGPDVAPKFYGEEPVQNLGDTDAFLDASEIALVKLTVAKRKPIFGICRGVQVINVALGGTLYQDLYSQRNHPTLQHYQRRRCHRERTPFPPLRILIWQKLSARGTRLWLTATTTKPLRRFLANSIFRHWQRMA